MKESLKERAINDIKDRIGRMKTEKEQLERLQLLGRTNGMMIDVVSKKIERWEWILRACEAMPEEAVQE